jgi:hypothetical protein
MVVPQNACASSCVSISRELLKTDIVRTHAGIRELG